jgi:hypothetical protein
MTRDNIRVSGAFVVSFMIVALLTSSIQLASGQENETEAQESVQIEGIIDELLQVHPVLSELMEDESAGAVEYLNGLETQEAVHTLLALKVLQDLVELQSSHAMAEGLGNQSATMANQTGTNQTASNQTGM